MGRVLRYDNKKKYQLTTADDDQAFYYAVKRRAPLVGPRASCSERKVAFLRALNLWENKSTKEAFIYGAQIAGLISQVEADKLRKGEKIT